MKRYLVKPPRTLLFFIALLGLSTAHSLDIKPDGINLSYGQYWNITGDREADFSNYRVGITWDLGEQLYRNDHIKISSFMEIAFSHWKSGLTDADDRSYGSSTANTISLSPVFRFAFRPNSQLQPFIDLGAGAAYLSEEDLEKPHQSDLPVYAINMGGLTQFELRAGGGVQFGSKQQFQLQYSWIHYSNADLHHVNDSIDFQLATLGLRW